MFEGETLKYADFVANAPIFSKLVDIRDFTLIADVPPIGGWSNDEPARFG